jgi:redox-sensing transcriptional repressor
VNQQTDGKPRAIPEATIARLAVYLRALTVMAESKFATSSEELAVAAGVNSATLRKDLSYLGTYGVRGVGYEIELLTAEIGRALGAHRQHRVALVGVGNLGAALAGYSGFVSRGLAIGALFDIDPQRVGHTVGGVIVEHVSEIVSACHREGISIGVIATPEPAAQSAADALVSAGVRAILAFTPGVIQVPDDVDLRKVDLAVELQILAFHESRRHSERPGDAAPLRAAGLRESSGPPPTVTCANPTQRAVVAAAATGSGWPSGSPDVHLATAAAQAPSTRSAR